MAISLTNIGTNSSKTNASTMAISVPVGGVPAGSLIVFCNTENSITTSVTDTASNTYNRYDTIHNPGIAYSFNSSALSSGNTITANNSATGIVQCISAFYATGIQTSSSPLDATAAAAGNTGTAVSITTTGATSVAGVLIVGVVNVNGPNTDTFTQDTTNEGGFSNFPVKVGTSGGSATSNFTLQGGAVAGWGSIGSPTYAPTLGTSRTWQAALATFKPAPTTTYFDMVSSTHLMPTPKQEMVGY